MRNSSDSFLSIQSRGFLLLLYCCAFAAAAIVYLPSVFLLPVGDDWNQITEVYLNAGNIAYPSAIFRLWQRVVYSIGFQLFGMGFMAFTLFLSLLTLLATAWLLSKITRQLVPENRLAPLAVASLYLLHPANTSAVIQLDAFSQILAPLLTLVMINFIVMQRAFNTATFCIVGTALIEITLLAKESVMGAVLCLPVVVYLRNHLLAFDIVSGDRFRTRIVIFMVATALAIYFWLRHAFGTPFDTPDAGRYALQWDAFRIALNALQLLGSSLFYGDSARFMIFGVTATTLASLFLSLALASAAIYGWFKKSHFTSAVAIKQLWLWLAFLPAALTPVIFLGSVSELYSAAMTPYVCIFIGVGIAQWIHVLQAGTARRFVAGFSSFLLVMVIFCGAMSVNHKIRLNTDVSAITWALTESAEKALNKCGAQPKFLLLSGNLTDTTSLGRPYSIYSKTIGQILKPVVWSLSNNDRRNWIEKVDVPNHDSANIHAAQCDAELDVNSICRLSCSAARYSK